MTSDDGPRECSAARALKLLGARWSLLVLRELALGVRRFDAMAAGTGAPRDVLTSRLRSLEQTGLVERRRYQDRPVRFEYHLTDLGHEAAEVVLALTAFGDRNLSVTPPVVWRHGEGAAEHDLIPVVACAACGQPARDGLHDPSGRGAPALT